jgi:salicylate hydroxylase
VEDAVVLARCLGEASRHDIPDALKRYETVRRPRVDRVQRASRDNLTTFHLADGDAQQVRDARYAALMAESPWAARGWLFAYDADAPEVIAPH